MARGEPETEVKNLFKTTGTPYKDFVAFSGLAYSTLMGYLNGFSVMPDSVRRDINAFIKMRLEHCESRVPQGLNNRLKYVEGKR